MSDDKPYSVVSIFGKPYHQYRLSCSDCGYRMVLRYSKSRGVHYGCTRGKALCRGIHSCHTDGTPVGTPGNYETRQWRYKAHLLFDRLWKDDGPLTRDDAYRWLRNALSIPSRKEAHIGKLSAEQCQELLKKLEEQWVDLMTGNWKPR